MCAAPGGTFLTNEKGRCQRQRPFCFVCAARRKLHHIYYFLFIISYLFLPPFAHQLQHLHRDVILLVPGAAGGGIGNRFGGAVGGVS